MPDNLSIGYNLNSIYQIIAIDDVGPYSTTYLGHDKVLDVDVTIKEYFPRDHARRLANLSVAPDSVDAAEVFEWGRKRYFAEAQSLAQLKAPGVPRVFSVFEANSTVYLVLERIDGPSIQAWLQSLGRRPTQHELDKMLQVLIESLNAVHSAGLLHRDITPESILIRKRDGLPMIINFSSTRIRTDYVTTPMVSSGYAPLEAYQEDDSNFGPWSDIYGLGAVIYKCVTGSEPPAAPTRMRENSYAPLTTIVGTGTYRPSFLKAVDWALCFRPQERPQSVLEWQKMLLPDSSAQLQKSSRSRQGSRIFISYRRADTESIAGRIYDHLEGAYGAQELFFDVSAIPVAVDFREHIRRSMLESAVLVAVVGKRWMNADRKKGWWPFNRRQSRFEDFVKIELELAFEYGIPIVPVLVDGAQMPSREILPKALSNFPDLNATSLRGGLDFKNDIGRLITAIDAIRGPRDRDKVASRL